MRTIRVAGVNVLLALLAVPVAAQPYLYVLSSGYTCAGRGCDTSRIADARVAVLDARTHQKVSTIPLAVTGAQRMAFAPDGRRLFITVLNQKLIVVDTATNGILSQIDVSLGQGVALSPASVAVAPDGSRVFLAAGRACAAAPCDDVHNPGVLIELDAATGAILRTADVGRNPSDLLLSPSGKLAYVNSPESANVAVVDTDRMWKVATVATPANPHAMTIAPDGGRLYVATGTTTTNSEVAVVDTAVNTIAARIFVSQSAIDGGAPVSAMTITPDGSRIVLARPNAVTTIDPARAAVVATVAIVPAPIEFTYGGRIAALSATSAYVTRAYGETDLVAAIDLQTGAVAQVPATLDAADLVVAPSAVTPPTGCAFTLSGAEVSGSTLILPADAPRLTIHVAADCGWTAATDAEWLSLSGPGVGAGWIGSATANDTLRPRRGRLTVTSLTMSAVYTVVQRALTRGALVIDAPSSAATLTQPFTIGGWALVQGALTPPGVDLVHVWAYPESGAPPIFAGSAPYGGARPDVAALFGPEYLSSGFTLQVRGLPHGRHLFAVFAWSNETRGFDLVASTSATLVPNVSDPWMNVDVPVADATVPGAFAIGGWALDRGASDSGVDAVHVWAYPEGNRVPLFVGAAARGPRPDVAAAFGAAYEMAGFHLHGSLPAGTYLLAVFARSTVTATFNNVRAFRIVVMPLASGSQ